MDNVIRFPRPLAADTSSEVHLAIRAAIADEADGNLRGALQNLSAALGLLAHQVAEATPPRTSRWVQRALDNELPAWSRGPEMVR